MNCPQPRVVCLREYSQTVESPMRTTRDGRWAVLVVAAIDDRTCAIARTAKATAPILMRCESPRSVSDARLAVMRGSDGAICLDNGAIMRPHSLRNRQRIASRKRATRLIDSTL